MFNNFSFSIPSNIIFEVGAVKSKLVEQIELKDISSILIVTDKGIIENDLLKDVEASLKKTDIEYKIFDGVKPNPSTDICHDGCKLAKQIKAEGLLAVGGGSSMDVAKAISILMTNEGSIEDYAGVADLKNNPLPIIAIPTTAGTGSEVTPYSVITIKAKNYKMTIVSQEIIPDVALLDPKLLTTVPSHIAAACGMDALTHAIESFTNLVASPATDAMGAEAIRLIGKYLRIYVANPEDIEAASGMLIASCLAGAAFGPARLGNCHAMAHPVSGFHGVAHGVANAILLPHIMKYNMLGDYGKYKRIADLMGEDVSGLSNLEAAPVAVEAVKKLSFDLNIPGTLSEVGVKEESIEQMSKDAMKSGNVNINPRKTTLENIKKLFHTAM